MNIKVLLLNELEYNCSPVLALPKRILKWCLVLKTKSCAGVSKALGII